MRAILSSLALGGLIAACGQDAPVSDAPAPSSQTQDSPARIDVPDAAPSVSPADFEPIAGDDWQGELVYPAPDGEEARQSIPASLSVSQDGRTLTLDFSFPGRPEGDGNATLEISEDGNWINDERIIQRETTNGTLRLLTRQECIEGRYIATCEYLYDLAADAFSIAKAVTLAGESEQRFGHQYSFTR